MIKHKKQQYHQKTMIIVFWGVLFFLPCKMHAQKWELDKDKNGIRVYTRKQDTNNIREYKAMTIVKTSMDKVLSIITDGDNLWRWNHRTVASKTLKIVSDNEFVFWMNNDLPWPIKDREIVSRVKVSRHENGTIIIDISPEKTHINTTGKKSILLEKFKGFWLLVPQGEYIEITQQLYGDPGGNLPAWLLNAVITTVPYRTFLNLKKILEN